MIMMGRYNDLRIGNSAKEIAPNIFVGYNTV